MLNKLLLVHIPLAHRRSMLIWIFIFIFVFFEGLFIFCLKLWMSMGHGGGREYFPYLHPTAQIVNPFCSHSPLQEVFSPRLHLCGLCGAPSM